MLSTSLMLLLGFSDDVLDLPWRAKILLPAISSLPLLCSYDGPTAVVIPPPLRWMLADPDSGAISLLGRLLDSLPVVVVDSNASGAIVELGALYWVCVVYPRGRAQAPQLSDAHTPHTRAHAHAHRHRPAGTCAFWRAFARKQSTFMPVLMVLRLGSLWLSAPRCSFTPCWNLVRIRMPWRHYSLEWCCSHFSPAPSH